MINIFTRANLRNLPTPSAWHVIATLLVIVVLQTGAIAYMLDMKVLAITAVANACYVAYMGVRS